MALEEPYKSWKSDKDIKNLRKELVDDYNNVYATALGPARVSGKRSDEPAIHALVDNKVDSEELDEKSSIPRYIDGVRIDVRELDREKIKDATGVHPNARLNASPTRGSRVRPLMGGIGPSKDLDPDTRTYPLDGTIGAIVTVGGNPAGLTNQHVLEEGGVSGTRPTTEPYHQPQRDGNNNIIGPALSWGADFSKTDWGLIDINSGVPWINEIIGLGRPTQLAEPSFNKRVVMSTRRSGLIGGELVSIDVDANSKLDYEYSMDIPPGGGTSGSVIGHIVNGEFRPFALHWGAYDNTPTRGVGNSFVTIQNESGLQFDTSDHSNQLPTASELYGNAYFEATVIGARINPREVDIRVVNAGGEDNATSNVSVSRTSSQLVDSTTVTLDAFEYTTVTLNWTPDQVGVVETDDESFNVDLSSYFSTLAQSPTNLTLTLL